MNLKKKKKIYLQRPKMKMKMKIKNNLIIIYDNIYRNFL